MSENNTPQEAWNMATATMQRLNLLLMQSSYYAQQCDLPNWNIILLDMRRNLIPFMDDKTIKEINAKFKSIPDNWSKGNKVVPSQYNYVYNLLDELFIIMITCMKQKGLLMPKSIDASRSVIDMG